MGAQSFSSEAWMTYWRLSGIPTGTRYGQVFSRGQSESGWGMLQFSMGTDPHHYGPMLLYPTAILLQIVGPDLCNFLDLASCQMLVGNVESKIE